MGWVRRGRHAGIASSHATSPADDSTVVDIAGRLQRFGHTK